MILSILEEDSLWIPDQLYATGTGKEKLNNVKGQLAKERYILVQLCEGEENTEYWTIK